MNRGTVCLGLFAFVACAIAGWSPRGPLPESSAAAQSRGSVRLLLAPVSYADVVGRGLRRCGGGLDLLEARMRVVWSSDTDAVPVGATMGVEIVCIERRWHRGQCLNVRMPADTLAAAQTAIATNTVVRVQAGRLVPCTHGARHP